MAEIVNRVEQLLILNGKKRIVNSFKVISNSLDMGTLLCKICFITAEANDKETAFSKIDHAANSKKCNGKDENCTWYSKGVPAYVPAGDIDPKRPIQGKVSKAAPKKSSK
jgi:hypothetical protein